MMIPDRENAKPFSHRRTLFLSLLLVTGTFALYSRVSQNQFLRYDDDRYVLENAHVRTGIHPGTVAWAFTSFEQANWHPLTWLSHALDCQLFGLNPARHHYVNLLLHVVSVLLLFLLLQSMTGHPIRSMIVAALFAVHPINVESVAWVAERKTVLCMVFFLLTLAAYERYVRRPSLARYVLVAFLFALALMSKPMAITLPFVLLLLDCWPIGDRRLFAGRSRYWGWLLLEKLPLFAMSAASAVITWKAQKAAGAVTVIYSPLVRLENAIVTYVLYIAKAVWPSRLAALYPYRPQPWPLWLVAASAIFLIVLTGLVLKYRQHRYLPVGWFWYLGTMVPMIGLVQVGNQAMADRYAYLPFIGLFILAVWGVAEAGSHVSRELVASAAVVVVVAFSVVTYRQLSYWHDDFALWSHTLAATHRNFVAEDNFGNALIQQGRYDEGIAHFRTAAEIEPGDPVSQVNLGIYAQQHGDLKQAAARYQFALRLTADVQLRASAFANLGGVCFTLHDYQRARENFESALKLNAMFPFVFLDLGRIAQRDGDWNDAMRYYALYVAVEPSDVGYVLLGQALEHAGQPERARLAYQQAQRVSKNIQETRQQVTKLLAD